MLHLLNCKGTLISLEEPKVMGILNITPDSFFDGGKYTDVSIALKQVKQMLDEGADFIDIGAQSTRPGSVRLSAKDEITRLEPFLKLVSIEFPELIFSVDTYFSDVARMAVDYGASIINDVSGGNQDADMFRTIGQLRCVYVLTHSPVNISAIQTSESNPEMLKEMITFFNQKIYELIQEGVCDIIIDLGFGFGKSLADNYRLINELDFFSVLEKPLLCGVSRKSMITKLLDISANEALPITSALHLRLLEKGANMLRVHDVKEAKHCVQVFNQLKKAT